MVLKNGGGDGEQLRESGVERWVGRERDGVHWRVAQNGDEDGWRGGEGKW